MRRALEILSAHRTDEVVLTVFTGVRHWDQVSRRPELDLPFWGAMGKAGSTGLGIALARPDVRVWVADGDGSLLMNLGALVTTAHMGARNLVHIVLENGTYATTGGQPIPGSGHVDFAALARAAGFPHAYCFED
jgi:thiamine pyrophosphate-dependent acetolactate synthase large subunit-like protein